VIAANDILHALLDKYGERHPQEGGQWACFPELARNTGGGLRYCDLFVVGLWSSNARAIAYEIKVDRADFQRELADPSKRQTWEPLASECWFAVPTGLVRPDEVPEGWGLLTMGEGGALRAVKKAQQRELPRWPFPFAQSIARRCADPPPPFPRGVMPLLNTGRPLGLLELRRLCQLLWSSDAQKRHAENYRASTQPQRGDPHLLGTLKSVLEQHFRTRIESGSQLRELLKGQQGSLPRDPHKASLLRELAELLDPQEGT
jgi:hypothetical protein